MNAVAGVIAAIAALGALVFAFLTVREARTARAENRRAHAEEIEETRTATKAAIAEQRAATEAAVAEQRAATTASANAHREQMAERGRVFAADMVVRRLEQLEQVAQLFLHLVEVSREEYFRPPAELDVGNRQMVTTTRVPAIVARL
ncbi:MAG: hypothetical protein JOZ73_05015, partial [Solirubrobacterales bacterium]|nr:hypothetical protein [Solirubrobacterales bacterium]